MAGSITQILDLIEASQSQKEVTANALFNAASPAMLYAYRAKTSAGLTWGYYGGSLLISGSIVEIPNGILQLTAGRGNWIEADPTTGAVSLNNTGWTAGKIPLYLVLTDDDSIIGYDDLRSAFSVASATTASQSPVSSVNAKTGAVTLTASDVSSIPSSALGAANGVAQLGADQKLLPAQLPAIAIVDYLGTVGSQSAMLALTGQKGDWCIRSDDGKVYTITGSDPTQISNWVAMSYPTGPGGTVSSVGLSVPGLLYTVSGSPVTGSGTLTTTLKTQTANSFLAGPTSGAAATPTMRGIVPADLPVMVASGASHAAGIVPDPGATAGTTKYLREDGNWSVPPGAGGGGTPGGSTTQMQFNDGGAFAGASMLTWDKTNNVLYCGDSAGGSVKIAVKPSSGGGNAANLTIAGGDSVNGWSGGKVSIYGGNPVIGATQNVTVEILGTSPTAQKAGSVNVQGGTANDFAGACTLAGGDAVSVGTGGTATVRGGDSFGGYRSGPVVVRGGDSTGNGGYGGDVTIRGGYSNAITFNAAPPAGAISITGGAASGNANQSPGGAVTIKGGSGGALNGAGGNVVIGGGSGGGTGSKGNVVLIDTGAALATSATGGFVCLPTCAGTPTGTPANVPTGSAPIVWDSANHALMMYGGGIWYTLGGGGSGGSSTLAGDTDVSISSPADGQVLMYEAATSKWKNKAGGSAVMPKLTILQRATVQSIASSTWVDISWDMNVQDDVSAFSSGTPTRITVPSGYTRVRITSYVAWANNSTGNRYHAIAKNGASGSIGPTFRVDAKPGMNETGSLLVSRWMNVSAGDYFVIGVNQTTSGALNLSGPAASCFGGPSEIQFEWMA